MRIRYWNLVAWQLAERAEDILWLDPPQLYISNANVLHTLCKLGCPQAGASSFWLNMFPWYQFLSKCLRSQHTIQIQNCLLACPYLSSCATVYHRTVWHVKKICARGKKKSFWISCPGYYHHASVYPILPKLCIPKPCSKPDASIYNRQFWG